MDGRIRKLGLGAVVVGGTLLFGIGLAGAQSSSGDSGRGGDNNAPVLIAHPNDGHVMIGASAGSSGCGGDGDVTSAVAGSLDL